MNKNIKSFKNKLIDDRIIDLTKSLIEALMIDGEVYAVGESIYCKKGFLMNTTDMCRAVKICGRADIRVERIDAGGSPRWAFSKELNL